MDEFNYIIKDLLENDKVNEMKIYMQHCNTSCFEHSYNVSYICYKICKKLNFDYVSASRGAMLHDFSCMIGERIRSLIFMRISMVKLLIIMQLKSLS